MLNINNNNNNNCVLHQSTPDPPNLLQREEGINILQSFTSTSSSGNDWHSLSPYSLLSPVATLSFKPLQGTFAIQYTYSHHSYFNRYLITGNDNKYCQKCIGR